MKELLFTVENVEPTVESVNEAIRKATDDGFWDYESQEEINKDIKDGYLEFENGTMKVYMD